MTARLGSNRSVWIVCAKIARWDGVARVDKSKPTTYGKAFREVTRLERAGVKAWIEEVKPTSPAPGRDESPAPGGGG